MKKRWVPDNDSGSSCNSKNNDNYDHDYNHNDNDKPILKQTDSQYTSSAFRESTLVLGLGLEDITYNTSEQNDHMCGPSISYKSEGFRFPLL